MIFRWVPGPANCLGPPNLAWRRRHQPLRGLRVAQQRSWRCGPGEFAERASFHDEQHAGCEQLLHLPKQEANIEPIYIKCDLHGYPKS